MSKEFKIGLLALVAGVFLYLGFNFLKGRDFFSQAKMYKVIYDDLAGLTVSSPVRLNGFQVGRVLDIEILQDQEHKLSVTLDVQSDLVIPAGSQAVLTDDGLLGGKMIALKIAEGNQNLKSGDTLVAATQASLVAELTEKADPIIRSTDEILHKFNLVMDTLVYSKEDIVALLKNFRDVSTTLNQTMSQGQLASTLQNFNKLSNDLAVLGKQLPPILKKADTMMNNLAKIDLKPTLDSATYALNILTDVLKKIEEGEGTLGALANDDSLYNNLNNVSENVDKLFIDMRENPKRYVQFSVFGKKEKKENGNQ